MYLEGLLPRVNYDMVEQGLLRRELFLTHGAYQNLVP
mgnify:CR=1 FL=1